MGKIKEFLLLAANYIFDFIQFIKHSNCFSINTEPKLRGRIIYYYHSLEKGLTNYPLKRYFGIRKAKKLKNYLVKWIKSNFNPEDSQFLSACTVLKKYYDFIKKNNENYNDLSELDLNVINNFSGKIEGGIVEYNAEKYFQNTDSNFKFFSFSRHSVRHFKDEKIDINLIEKIIEIAGNAPSVCNRQAWKVKLIVNKDLVEKILTLQAGFNISNSIVNQLFIVSVDRSAFISSAEWYQCYIDGGIFLQNLLYALHYHKIAAVALNWSKHFFYDRKIKKWGITKSNEKIISIVVFGYPQDEFKVPVSKRKYISEILEIID